jgi:sugar phosphate isomerase/epimerase
MNPRHRWPSQLTLGFLTLGAEPAPADVIAAAAAAGFGAAGLRISARQPGGAWPPVDGRPQAFEELRDQARTAGVRISSASGYYITPETRAEHLQANVDAARRLGAPLVVQGCFDPDLDRVGELLHGYARAAEAAGVRIAIEFMPMSTVRNVAAALRLIEAVPGPALGLVVDTLHFARSGDDARVLRDIDPSRIGLLQICDAPAVLGAGSTLFDEAMTGRLYPGDGELPLAGYLQALPAGCEIECETPVSADAGLPLAQRAAHSAARAGAFYLRHFAPAAAADAQSDSTKPS